MTKSNGNKTQKDFKIPDSCVITAKEMLKDGKTFKEKLGGILEKVSEKKPAASGLLSKMGALVEYFLDFNVPIYKKILILSALIWIILPDPIPLWLDDILLTVYILPKINNELEKYRNGDYSPKQKREEKSILDSENPFVFKGGISTCESYKPKDEDKELDENIFLVSSLKK